MFFAMVFFLIQNVLIHCIHLGMGVGEGAIAVLPGKFIGEELLVIDEITAVVFDIADQIGNRHGWPETNKNMDMIRDTIYDDRLLVFVFDDTRHVFEYLFSPGFLQQILPAFYCKNILDVDLSISSSHFDRFGGSKVAGWRNAVKALLTGFDQGKSEVLE